MEPTEQVQGWLMDFIAGRRETERAFVLALREEVWKWIHSLYADLVHDARELEGRVFDLLLRWRAEPAKLKAEEPLWMLARRLVEQVGDAERSRVGRDGATAREFHSLQELGGASANAEANCIARDLARKVLELVFSLPPEDREVLRAAMRAEADQGPPLAEVLGTSPDIARMRLVRARHALVKLALRAKVLVRQDLPSLTRKKEITHV